MQLLLDATDRRGRVLQNGSVIGGALVACAGVWLVASGSAPVGAVLLIVGLAATILGVRIKQRWDVDYRGHRIRFANSPTSGEKLFIDDRLAARGWLGLRMELNATILEGEAAGDELVALVEAGLLTFRLQLFARTVPN